MLSVLQTNFCPGRFPSLCRREAPREAVTQATLRPHFKHLQEKKEMGKK